MRLPTRTSAASNVIVIVVCSVWPTAQRDRTVGLFAFADDQQLRNFPRRAFANLSTRFRFVSRVPYE
jgi:hypothetical protein